MSHVIEIIFLANNIYWLHSKKWDDYIPSRPTLMSQTTNLIRLIRRRLN